MARDCPDRQRGASWRNDGPDAGRTAGRIGSSGGGDAVDREYEVCSTPFRFFSFFASNILTCTSNSCKNSVVPALLLPVLKLAPALSAMVPAVATAMLSPGNGDPLAALLPGVLATWIVITKVVPVALLADPLVARLLGLVIVTSAGTMIATEETATMAAIAGMTTTAEAPRVVAAARPLGTSLLRALLLPRRSPRLRRILVLMVVILAMVLLPVWALPRLLGCLLRLLELLPACPDRLTLSSSNMPTQLLPRPLRQLKRLLRLPWISLPLPLPVLEGH